MIPKYETSSPDFNTLDMRCKSTVNSIRFKYVLKGRAHQILQTKSTSTASDAVTTDVITSKKFSLCVVLSKSILFFNSILFVWTGFCYLFLRRQPFWAVAPEGPMTYGTTQEKFSVSRFPCPMSCVPFICPPSFKGPIFGIPGPV